VRLPTPPHVALAWWAAALTGKALPLIEGEPQCGFYRRRLVKGGPWVAARIWLEQETDPDTGELLSQEVIRCEVDGQTADPLDQWAWLCANPIPEAEYQHLRALRGWAKHHAEDHPLSNPTRPVDWTAARIPF
jgi:hypothetical protein